MQSTHKTQNAQVVLELLQKMYPNAGCTLDFTGPLELLIATILAAQCTDVRVNIVTKELFKKYPTVEHYAQADPKELEQDIKSTGFYQNKTKSIITCCRQIIERYQGQVPSSMEALTALAGVGRKTANVVLGNAFNIPGIIVDTHMRRVSQRLGLTSNDDPVKIERDLCAVIPQMEWVIFSHRMVEHGRKICIARNPRCSICLLAPHCRYFQNLNSGK
ncbi:MAG: endonuclease III [Candidatus Schekmanbacteria bacterium]|nr:endonuclease III [Candidatus Schekmanbacteria bacterium]